MQSSSVRISISERITTSIGFAVCIALTIAITPILISLKGAFVGGIKLYAFYTHWLFILSIVVSIFLGFIMGRKSFVILGHLWYTEKPHNNQLTTLLWVVIIGIGVITYAYS